jgi:zinc/manganese transport system permease protein
MIRAFPMCVFAVGLGAASSITGLLVSYHLGIASGPAIILTAGVIYLASMLAGRRGLISARMRPHRHRAA